MWHVNHRKTVLQNAGLRRIVEDSVLCLLDHLLFTLAVYYDIPYDLRKSLYDVIGIYS